MANQLYLEDRPEIPITENVNTADADGTEGSTSMDVDNMCSTLQDSDSFDSLGLQDSMNVNGTDGASSRDTNSYNDLCLQDYASIPASPVDTSHDQGPSTITNKPPGGHDDSPASLLKAKFLGYFKSTGKNPPSALGKRALSSDHDESSTSEHSFLVHGTRKKTKHESTLGPVGGSCYDTGKIYI